MATSKGMSLEALDVWADSKFPAQMKVFRKKVPVGLYDPAKAIPHRRIPFTPLSAPSSFKLNSHCDYALRIGTYHGVGPILKSVLLAVLYHNGTIGFFAHMIGMAYFESVSSKEFATRTSLDYNYATIFKADKNPLEARLLRTCIQYNYMRAGLLSNFTSSTLIKRDFLMKAFKKFANAPEEDNEVDLPYISATALTMGIGTISAEGMQIRQLQRDLKEQKRLMTRARNDAKDACKLLVEANEDCQKEKEALVAENARLKWKMKLRKLRQKRTDVEVKKLRGHKKQAEGIFKIMHINMPRKC